MPFLHGGSVVGNKINNNKIHKPHERALRIVCDDFNSKVEELLNIDGSFTKTSPKHLDIGNRNV